MKNLITTKSTLNNVFSFIEGTLGTQSKYNSGDYKLDLNNELCEGLVHGYDLKNGISYLDIDLTFKKNYTLNADFNSNNILSFAYCSAGNLNFKMEGDTEFSKLNHFQTAIINNCKNRKLDLEFKKDEATKVSIILVERDDSLQQHHSNLRQSLISVFNAENLSKNFVYISSYNLKIAEQISKLPQLHNNDFIRNIMLEGTIYTILGLELQQHLIDIENKQNAYDLLSRSQFEIIKNIAEEVKTNPELPHCIDSVLKKHYLSAAKLQLGFKTLYNATFTEFLREARLVKAEELIRTTDRNISEVVYSVGFSSRSYFSRIFKDKYNCSPSDYKKNLIGNFKMIA